MSGFLDTYHRRIDYMRISVTDRCDLNCVYCTEKSVTRLSHDDILRYEEIQKIVQAAARLGVRGLRITGGEPLVRPNISELIKLLIKVEGIDDITLTTNGTQLGKYVEELKEAGLKRVNISLDTLNKDKYQQITGSDRLSDVLQSVEAALKVGLTPVKINMVVMRGVNDDELLEFARMSANHGWNIRFIEMMPLVHSKPQGDRLVSIEEIRTVIEKSLGILEPCLTTSGRGPAKYYRLPGTEGTIGFIGPVTECFCATCNRFRITADGRLRPCLLEDDEIDIKTPLRADAGIDEIEELMQQAALLKKERHRLDEKYIRGQRQMWQIGG
ncbi:MAG: GTP 3',8-cyclase MoaA [Dehalococcoidia bacterium]|nr:MAG: GTP 3',8-cyclase MoaA [Dehalococcoidia bacterium]